jgi:hypothetical protein
MLHHIRQPQVSDFDPLQVRHTVAYDDGDTEIIRLWGANQQVGPAGIELGCVGRMQKPERGGGTPASQAAAGGQLSRLAARVPN